MHPRLLILLVCAVALPSCATGNRMVAKVRDFSIADIRPAKIDVVEVREKDLKDLPTGEERLLAYQRSGGRFSWLFGGARFQEPDLPAEGMPMDGGLLPSLD